MQPHEVPVPDVARQAALLRLAVTRAESIVTQLLLEPDRLPVDVHARLVELVRILHVPPMRRG